MKGGKLHHRARDLTGQTFGALTALRPTHGNGKKVYWIFRCECGTECVKCGANITKEAKRGGTPNCGCLTKALQSKPKSHGMSTHPVYAVWRSMVDRCRLPTHQAYHNYGARGITVCKRWLKFENFWADMEEGYALGLTLDRINNNRGYSKRNCRWVNYIVQANNRQGVLPFDIRMAEEVSGANRTTLYYRWHNGLSMTSPTPDPDRDSWSEVMRDRS